MCVIIHSLRKKHLKMLEVRQAMRHNSSGFWMAHWPQGSKSPEDRKTLRTLSENDAIRFFNSVPDDDEFVMHARIPSKGGVSLDNVHGWEEDGVLFAHNMTMGTLSELMTAEKWEGTDSEYFFRRMFMPMHRGEHLANPDLKPGEMGPATRRMTSLLCGSTNKFLFVMPDNTVIRAGQWETVASEKTKRVEEREIDEVVGGTIDASGRFVAKTEKVKKTIEVEVDQPVAVASNLHHRSVVISDYDPARSGFYGHMGGRESWRGRTNEEAYLNGETMVQSEFKQIAGYGGAKSTYKSDYEAWKEREARKKTCVRTADAADLEKFLEFRAITKVRGKDGKIVNGYTAVDLEKEVLMCCDIFPNANVSCGAIDIGTMRRVFGAALRCIIYDNLQFRNKEIVKNAFGGSMIGDAEREEMISGLTIYSGFNGSGLAQDIATAIAEIPKRVGAGASGGELCLPSEAVYEAIAKMMREINDTVAAGFAETYEQAATGVTELDYSQIFTDNIQALDTLLNVSIDGYSKGNKEIARYAKAGIIRGRKIDWIPTPLLLAVGKNMICDSSLSWNYSDVEVRNYVGGLNILAEACSSEGKSLEREDRRYVAEIKRIYGGFGEKTDGKDGKPEAVEAAEVAEPDGGKELAGPESGGEPAAGSVDGKIAPGGASKEAGDD